YVPSLSCCSCLPESCLYCTGLDVRRHIFPTRRASDLLIRPIPARTSPCALSYSLLLPVQARLLVRSPFLPVPPRPAAPFCQPRIDRKSTRLNSSHVKISYAVLSLQKKTRKRINII